MLYENKEYKFSIEVGEDFILVPKENFKEMGLQEPAISQTIMLFISNAQNQNLPQSFNITRDAVYNSDEEAMTKGIELNLTVLKESGATILKEKDAQLENGIRIKFVSLKFQNMNMCNIFLSINNMLICLGYINNDLNIEIDKAMIQVIQTLKISK